jgi:hypothetical protein
LVSRYKTKEPTTSVWLLMSGSRLEAWTFWLQIRVITGETNEVNYSGLTGRQWKQTLNCFDII